MIIGNPSIFALESEITCAYERRGLLALGFFVIHVGGLRYGVYSPDASMLACSFDEVERRITFRGMHTAFFAAESDAAKIADAFLGAFYSKEQHDEYFEISHLDFSELIHAQHIQWTPDGDEAFDDGSFVLQFDIGDHVRLIAFKGGDDNNAHDPITLRDVWLESNVYYDVLEQWHDTFETTWSNMLKSFDKE